MARAVVQPNYKVVTSDNFSLVTAENIKAGDSLKSWDIENRVFTDVEVAKVNINVDRLSAIYIEVFDVDTGFLVPEGACHFEDGHNQWVSHDPNKANELYGVTPMLWHPSVQAIAQSISEDNDPALIIFDTWSESDLTSFMTIELVSGNNIFFTPNDQVMPPVSFYI